MKAICDIAKPRTQLGVIAYDGALILLGALMLALFSIVKIPLGFTPVPLALQPCGIFVVAAALGTRRGTLSTLLYLLMGAVGFPVFAGGGSGLAYLLGPTMGYLAGYVASTYLVAFLLEKGWKTTFWKSALAFLLGTATIYLCGVIWLSCALGAGKAALLGICPFIPLDLVKIALSAYALTTVWKKMNKSFF